MELIQVLLHHTSPESPKTLNNVKILSLSLFPPQLLRISKQDSFTPTGSIIILAVCWTHFDLFFLQQTGTYWCRAVFHTALSLQPPTQELLVN